MNSDVLWTRSPSDESPATQLTALLADIAAREKHIHALYEGLRAIDRGLHWSRGEWRARLASAGDAPMAMDYEHRDADEEPIIRTATAAPPPNTPATGTSRGQRRPVRQTGRPAHKQAHRKRH